MSNKNTDFWYFSRRERNATLILLLTLIVLFLLPALYRALPDEPSEPEKQAFRKAILEFEEKRAAMATPPKVADLFYFDPNTADETLLLALGLPTNTISTIIKYRNKIGRFTQAEDLQQIYNLDSADFSRIRPYVRIAEQSPTKTTTLVNRPTVSIKLTFFDPNKAEAEQLLTLGLSKKVVRNIEKYREKGGQFRRPQDLKKIYGMTEADFVRLEPYIQLTDSKAKSWDEETTATEFQKTPPVAVNEQVSIDINRSTAEDWQQLYGIGTVLSGRIIKFRDLLGGFHSVDQVAETYGLPDSTFQSIREQLQHSPIKKPLNINKMTEEDLKSHPYIKWQQARVIVAYREEHGPFREQADLKQVLALDEAFINRISPYLNFGI